MSGLPTLVSRILMGAALLVLILVGLQIRSCQQARQRAAESRVERAQGSAAVESARDAIATQGAAAARERASQDLTSANDKEIHDATGADAPIPPAVSAAGRDSLCRRAAYRGSQYCLQRAAPAGVDQRR